MSEPLSITDLSNKKHPPVRRYGGIISPIQPIYDLDIDFSSIISISKPEVEDDHGNKYLVFWIAFGSSGNNPHHFYCSMNKAYRAISKQEYELEKHNIEILKEQADKGYHQWNLTTPIKEENGQYYKYDYDIPGDIKKLQEIIDYYINLWEQIKVIYLKS